MSFDRNNPTDLATLKSEIVDDPLGMNYGGINAPHPQILNLLNDPDENLGGETTNRVFDPKAMIDALVVDDLGAGPTNDAAAAYIHILVELGAYEDIEPYKTEFRDLFAANSDTVANLDAQNSAISRGAVLFGAGTVLNKLDWFSARDS